MDDLQRQIDTLKTLEKFCQTTNIEEVGLHFEEYSKVYAFTNEVLFRLFRLIDLSNYKNALCVLSSGDHAFELIYRGILNIDTFDCNRLTEYYALGFKKTAIEVLNFTEFYKYFTIWRNYDQGMEDYIISCMPLEYKNFWMAILNARKEFNPNKANIREFYCSDGSPSYNMYFHKYDYDILKENLKHANITYTYADVTELPTKFQTYDFIELSNIVGWLRKKNPENEIISLIENIYDKNLNPNGEMVYTYKHGLPNYEDSIYKGINRKQKLIRDLWGEYASCLKK